MPLITEPTPLRIIFMGTADLACASLEALCAEKAFSLVAVVSQPDKPKGRDLKLQPTAVKSLAQKLSIPILQPERARNPDFIEQLRALKPDLIAVAAYGQILPQALLDIPLHGCLNVHTSLLPKYRGAAPIQWAILEGESETGVTLMQMNAGMDTGDILAQVTTPIEPTDNAQILHDRLALLGGKLLVKTIHDLVAGGIQARPQPAEGATHARKITKEDGRLDWSQPAKKLWNRIRAFTPWPGAFTHFGTASTPQLLKIWEATLTDETGKPGEIISADKTGIVVGCGEQSLRILSLQKEGGRKMTAQEFASGNKLATGEFLGL